jgi:hypothetical protein
MEKIFLFGSCLNFHLILRSIFPEAKPYYNVDHIITEIDGKYYDITGQVFDIKGFLPYHEYYNKKQMSRSFTQMYNFELKLR